MKRLLLLITICISLFSFGQVPNYVPTNGLIGWWGFNGNANDESGNGNNGTVNGATLTTDRFNYCESAYNYDGLNNYIDYGNASILNPINQITISAWVYPDSLNPTGASIIQRLTTQGGSSYGISIGTAGIGMNLNNSSTGPPDANTMMLSASATLFENQWYHIVGTYDGSELQIFLDGQLIGTLAGNYSLDQNSWTNISGVDIDPTGINQQFIGKIDDLGIWDRALTASEIQNLYNVQLGNGNISSSETVSECDTYTWSTNGQTYTQSGQYTEVLTNQVGCDSTVTLNLTITNSNTGSETVTECDSYTWNTNGQTYTQSGQYTEVLTNQVGCDSTVTLNLTINSSSSSTQTDSGVDSYTWSVNNQTYTQSGTYTAVVPNASGCDSTITLDLTLQFTGLDENETSYIAVYPNPTFNTFTLSTKDMIHMNYTLVDIQGKVVLTGKIESIEQTVDISKLSKGQYNLVFEDESISPISIIKN